MDNRHRRRKVGVVPRNDLGSSKIPKFRSQDPRIQDYHHTAKIIDQTTVLSVALPVSSSPSIFSFGDRSGDTLSHLGNSSSLFSFSPPDSPLGSGARQSTPSKLDHTISHAQIEAIFGSSSSLDSRSRPILIPHSRSDKGVVDNMVVEREPPKSVLSPSKVNQQPPVPKTGYVEFGKPSTLQSPLTKSIFNIPKPNHARPEHHRSVARSAATTHTHKPTVDTNNDFVDPFAPRPPVQTVPTPKSPILGPVVDDDVVEIPRPTNAATWSSYPASRPLYSSGTETLTNSHRLGNLIDLTATALSEDNLGVPEPYNYVDPEIANENIKALLEGAFDDEDKPRTRGGTKKLKEKTADLVDKLKGLEVGPEDTLEKGDGSDEDQEKDDGAVEGLKIKLLPHQVNGVEWMRQKETRVKKKNGILPKGGILADDMGLGKTIQTLALLLTNPRPPLTSTYDPKDDKTKIPNSVGKNTLVVAPLALIRQWESEISNRVESSHKLRVCVHHGPQRTKRFEELRRYDVVITTYQILVSEHGSSSKNDNGPQVGCFGIDWYRVILDEAHTIKNRNAKATQACYALRSEYRWCLTGTPCQNNLDELQSLIRFLRIKPYNELSVWRDQITRPLANGRGGVAIGRLQVFLKACMKRRTKDVLKAEGALAPGGRANGNGEIGSGFKITERRVENVVAHLSSKERTFYERLERRADKSLEEMMGGKKLNYAGALVLLLRLRQACNHPELVGGSLAKDKDALTTGQSTGILSPRKVKAVDDELDNVADLLGGLSVQTRECDMCRIALTREQASSGAIRCSDCEDNLADMRSKRRKNKNHGKPARQSSHEVKSDHSSRRKGNARLRVLDSDDENDEGGGDWLVDGDDRRASQRSKAGGTDDENAEGEGHSLGLEDSDTENDDSSEETKSPKIQTTAVESSSDGETDSLTDDESTDSGNSSPSKITSTKIQHLLSILKRESATHKFIVFSQFTSMLDLIEPHLKKERLVFTRYDGSMRNDLREASLQRLREERRTRILLCSLKCGSLGLNLTAASRVVILEPFWNPFVEEQAIDRVHRLNQTVDVIIYKLTIANSVEERILDLQEKKRALAEAAIEGKSVAKLSLQDMLNLFKREAEHDRRYDVHLDLGAKTRMLESTDQMVSAREMGSTAEKGESRRATPPVGKKTAPREESVWSRRWS